MISCQICQQQIHSVELHLSKDHPGITMEQYAARWPDAPIFSEEAKQRIAQRALEQQQQQQAAQAPAPVTLHHAALAAQTPVQPAPAAGPRVVHSVHATVKRPLHEIFNLPAAGEALNGRGQPIPINVYQPAPETRQFVPEIDEAHVWNIDDLKNELLAIEKGWPLLIFGHKGTGKSTDAEQIAARCKRPLIRVQHTANTEEAHIIGQWTVQDGNTVYELAPLPYAMLHGMIYLADEYDVANPGVCAAYQPVLEGKPLVIKDAPPHLRVIKPAPGFTFVATGNTNGTGDASGLYPGTTVQNSANYDRFVIKLKKNYMPAKLETDAIVAQSGIAQKEAEKLVKLATEIRTMYSGGKLSDTISTRALVNIAHVAILRGKPRLGIQLCYANGLNEVDYQAVDGVAQRLYG